ncbi:MAG: hypothetical protein IJA19_06785 [Clostridia bacterium]|nr:hypothetical protein [Clostridia bacterium]MBQ4543855.1 hypothetical protein [Clostridia bacterium]
MVVEEFLNDNKLVRHYSDSGMMLLQKETGHLYIDAIDVVPCKYSYVETDKLIEKH